MMKREWSEIALVPLEEGRRRDEAWLQALLDTTWDAYFADVPQDNDVRIVFGRRAKRRLGSIGLDPSDRSTSVITMNSIFKADSIPEFVIVATLVHELTHYAHGFNSPLAKSQAHPHAGGVIRKEYADRGLLDLYLQQKRWLRANWPEIVSREFVTGRPVPARRTVSSRPRQAPEIMGKIPRPWWLG